MNILLSKNSFAGPISGADEIAVNYAAELKAAGHEASVLLVQPPAPGDPLAARLCAAGVELTALASPRFTASLAAGRKLALAAMRAFSPAKKVLRSNSRRIVHDLLQRYHDAFREHLARRRPDVVHVITPDPGAVMFIRAAHSAGVPVVYQEVGTPFHPPGFEEVYERFVKVLPLCSEVATLSPSLAREMRRAVPSLAREPRVVPLIAPDAADGLAPARDARPAGSPVRFGFASRLEHLKGPLQLVEGFAAAHGAHPEVELRIAGEGSQRQQVLAVLRRHGLAEKSRMVGTYTTLEARSRFMRDLDVFVHPSFTEGTPNAVIEAMAHGLPVVATDVGGLPDFVTGDCGVLVPAGDAGALGEAMKMVAGDANLRRSMGLAAREQYRRLFTSGVVMPLLTDFYRRVIAAHGASGNGHGAAGRSNELRHPWAEGAGAAEATRRDDLAAVLGGN
ncbi:MAG: glycosyltransferase family 4 protein [Acidobacteria bacterium]|nr:glycosyltransferase family 4 protein [Acidobacteriota bacterium]MCA1620412.1 glycosyltransferase family 4 protein [Acidobacteriota bacterium]